MYGVYTLIDNDPTNPSDGSNTTAVLTTAGTTTTEASPINWAQYDLNIPSLNIPTIDVPGINFPLLEVASIDAGLTDIPALSKDTVNIAAISTDYDNTTALSKEVSNKATLEIPQVTEMEVNELNDIKNFEKNIVYVDTNQYDGDFNEWMTFIKSSKDLFKDQRSIFYDKSFIKTNKIASDWIEIYKQYKDKAPVQYVAIQKKFKMITEVRPLTTTDQLNILSRNLQYYKSQGYDSVLVAFDKDDTLTNTLNTILYIKKYFEMDVWLTYTGKEDLNVTVFMNKDKYQQILSSCAPHISGYINSWRRTSSHLFEQDTAFMNFTNYTLRSANSQLPIIGELYYGNSHKFDEIDKVGFILNNFQNSSGIMIVNFGFNRIDFKYLFDVVLKPYLKNAPKIGCVVGQRPYYMTTYNNHLTYAENMKIKHSIENKFFEYGCIGTVTLSNDGREAETNNISVTPYDTLQGK